jgi:tetratricopeptide (TPR) repeat protein
VTPENSLDWWQEALALERADKLEQAETLLDQALPHEGVYSQTAELYRQRMKRLLAAGDRAGAIAAYWRGLEWMQRYAASASSGGEGLARAGEGERFKTRLIADLGFEP